MFFFFKQKAAYEVDVCDWCSDVCSSDLREGGREGGGEGGKRQLRDNCCRYIPFVE